MKFDRRQSLGYMTNWAARLFARAIDRRLRPHGLSSGHMPIFFALGDGQSLTQKRLAELAAIEQPTMAATLSRMERDGLIARRPDPEDGRRALVSLTPRALELAPAVRAAAAEVNAIAGAAVDGGEAEIIAALAAIVDVLEEDAERDEE